MHNKELPAALKDEKRLTLLAAWAKGVSPSIVAQKLRVSVQTVVDFYHHMDEKEASWHF